MALKDLARKDSYKLGYCENEVEKIIEGILFKAIEHETGNGNYKKVRNCYNWGILPLRLWKDRKTFWRPACMSLTENWGRK